MFIWELVSFVKRARIRRQILELIQEFPSTPTELAKATNNHRPSVSRALIDLEGKKLVICLTPNEKLGRLYKTTEKGSKTLELLKKINKK